jgi:hypothetical protein
LKPEDTEKMRALFVELCYLITEPFFQADTPGVRADLFDQEGAYKWGESDLPKRVAKLGAECAFAFKLRSPPREIVFLDRKLGGTFILLSTLKVQIRARDFINPYVL